NGGGLYNYGGTMVLRDSTIASNAASVACGGVYNYPVAFSSCGLGSSIIASNSAPNSPDVKGTFTESGFNLLANTNGGSGFTAATDQIGVDPKLGPLADNGGPTKTMGLLPGSPAIDKGTNF